MTIRLGVPDRWDYLTVDPASHRVYLAHGDRVTVVDGHDGAILGEVTGFPGGTHGIVEVSADGHGYADDGRAGDSGTITVIDPKADRAIATVDAGGKLEFGVSGLNGKLYVNGAGRGEIVRVDTQTNLADAHWPMPGCVSPHGLAIDRASGTHHDDAARRSFQDRSSSCFSTLCLKASVPPQTDLKDNGP